MQLSEQKKIEIISFTFLKSNKKGEKCIVNSVPSVLVNRKCNRQDGLLHTIEKLYCNLPYLSFRSIRQHENSLEICLRGHPRIRSICLAVSHKIYKGRGSAYTIEKFKNYF